MRNRILLASIFEPTPNITNCTAIKTIKYSITYLSLTIPILQYQLNSTHPNLIDDMYYFLLDLNIGKELGNPKLRKKNGIK